jgi:hypothetical protein
MAATSSSPFEVVDISHRNRSAFARQQLGDCGTNAGRTARDQRDLALNLPRHFHSHRYCWFYLIIAGP